MELPKNLSDDLRKMNEKQFVKLVEWLKTLKRKEMAEAISKNPQLILPIRILLGLTRHSFSRKVSINFHTLKRVETRKVKRNKNSILWGEKISNFLSIQPFLNTSKEDLEERWVIAKRKNFEDVDTNLMKRLRKEFVKLELPEDLRKIRKEQFLKLMEWLENKIEEFELIPHELLMVKPQLIWGFRMMCGMSQKEFAQKLGVNHKWVRDVESSRRFLEDTQTINRILFKLNHVIKEEKAKKEIILANFERFKISTHSSMRNLQRKTLREMSKEDIEKLFNEFREKTNDFKLFPVELIMSQPNILMICRLALGLGNRKFAKLLNVGERWFREKETCTDGMSFHNARKLKEKLESIFSNKKVKKETVLLNFFKFKTFRAHRNSNLHGCKIAERMPLERLEKEVLENLNGLNIKIHTHHTIFGSKKFVNVDFFIISNSLKSVIEVIDIKNLNILKSRVREIDHKFRGIKLFDPSIKTILVIKIPVEEEELLLKEIKRKLWKEIFDTDFLVLNNIEELKRIVEEDT